MSNNDILIRLKQIQRQAELLKSKGEIHSNKNISLTPINIGEYINENSNSSEDLSYAIRIDSDRTSKNNTTSSAYYTGTDHNAHNIYKNNTTSSSYYTGTDHNTHNTHNTYNNESSNNNSRYYTESADNIDNIDNIDSSYRTQKKSNTLSTDINKIYNEDNSDNSDNSNNSNNSDNSDNSNNSNNSNNSDNSDDNDYNYDESQKIKYLKSNMQNSDYIKDLRSLNKKGENLKVLYDNRSSNTSSTNIASKNRKLRKEILKNNNTTNNTTNKSSGRYSKSEQKIKNKIINQRIEENKNKLKYVGNRHGPIKYRNNNKIGIRDHSKGAASISHKNRKELLKRQQQRKNIQNNNSNRYNKTKRANGKNFIHIKEPTISRNVTIIRDRQNNPNKPIKYKSSEIYKTESEKRSNNYYHNGMLLGEDLPNSEGTIKWNYQSANLNNSFGITVSVHQSVPYFFFQFTGIIPITDRDTQQVQCIDDPNNDSQIVFVSEIDNPNKILSGGEDITAVGIAKYMKNGVLLDYQRLWYYDGIRNDYQFIQADTDQGTETSPEEDEEETLPNIYALTRFTGNITIGDDEPRITLNQRAGVFALIKFNPQFIWLWIHQITGIVGNFVDMAVDSVGNIYIGGTFTGRFSITDRSPGTDGGTGNEIVVLTTDKSSDIFLIKLNTDGEFIWAKVRDNINVNNSNFDYGTIEGVTVTKGSEYPAVTGSFKGVLIFDGEEINSGQLPSNGQFVGLYNMWVGLFQNTDGDTVFIQTVEHCLPPFVDCTRNIDAEYIGGKNISSDGDDNLYVIGTFIGIYDFNYCNSSNEFIVDSNWFLGERENIFIAKLDDTNEAVWSWARQIVSSTTLNSEYYPGIETNFAGISIVTGQFITHAAFSGTDNGGSTDDVLLDGSGSLDMFAIQIDNNGIWYANTASRFAGTTNNESDHSGADDKFIYIVGTNTTDTAPNKMFFARDGNYKEPTNEV